MRVGMLRAELEARDLPTTGNKSQLVERLKLVVEKEENYGGDIDEIDYSAVDYGDDADLLGDAADDDIVDNLATETDNCSSAVVVEPVVNGVDSAFVATDNIGEIQQAADISKVVATEASKPTTENISEAEKRRIRAERFGTSVHLCINFSGSILFYFKIETENQNQQQQQQKIRTRIERFGNLADLCLDSGSVNVGSANGQQWKQVNL